MADQSLKEATAKGLLWGGISNGVQQIVGLFFGFFLARLLTPNDYGIIGMLSIFTGIANGIQEGGFIAALTNRKNIQHADYNAVFWFNIVAGIFLYILLFFCAPLIAEFFNKEELIDVSRVLFLSFLFSSFGTAQAAYLFRNLKVEERAKIDIFSLIISNTVAAIMTLNHMAYWAIVIQIVLYFATGTLLRWHYSSWRPTFSFQITLLKEMLPFSSKLLATNIFNQITINIFSLLLGKFYNSQQVGYYYQAHKWMNAGQTFTSGMLTGVTQPVLAHINHEKERQVNIFRKLIRFTAFLSFPLMLGLAFTSYEIILLAVTDKWLPCVTILQTLCIWGAFAPIREIYKNLLISHGKSGIFLWNNIIFGVLQIGILFLIMPYGILWMVKGYVALYLISLFVWHYFASQLIPLRLMDICKDIIPYLIITISVLLVVYFLSLNIENLYLKLICKIVTFILLYILIMWQSNSVIFKEIFQFFLKRIR